MSQTATATSPVLDILRGIGGIVGADELAYQCDRRGVDNYLERTKELVDQGLVEESDEGFALAEQADDGEMPARQDRVGTHTAWTEEELVDRINVWMELFGEPPSSNDWNTVQMAEKAKRLRAAAELLDRKLKAYEEGDFPSSTTVRERFGSWSAGLVAAGFAPREQHRPRSSQAERLSSGQARAIRKTLAPRASEEES